MLDLGKIREEIDSIDSRIVQLFEERMKLAEEVAEFKIETGKAVFDKKREEEKLSALTAMAGSSFNACGVQELFSHIMSISRKRQYQLLAEHGREPNLGYEFVEKLPVEHVRVVFQGVEGAYSFAAMHTFFGENIDSFHVKTFKEAMEAIHSGRADYAVLPIENSTAGSVQDCYDLLAEYEHSIVGEQIIQIDHALLGVKGSSLSDIRSVISHPQALAQCRKYLENHPEWDQREYLNTALAAKLVAEEQNKSKAAIASRYAAEYFGLEVLNDKPLSQEGNSTRFIIVSGRHIYTPDASKISICLELPHKSGTLYNILSHMIYNNLNMTKIESRPIPERTWEYRFFVDFEGNLNESAVKNALLGIEQEAVSLRVLGNY